MSLFGDVRGSRLLARYRIMFRASTMTFGAAVVFAALGLLALVFIADPKPLLAALFLAVMSVLNCYKIAVSTMRLIDVEAGEDGWRSLGV